VYSESWSALAVIYYKEQPLLVFANVMEPLIRDLAVLIGWIISLVVVFPFSISFVPWKP
jgi:hypothetical protein